MKTIEINTPRNGIYSDKNFVNAFNRLLENIENFIPSDVSSGNLSLKGNGAMAVAKAKMLKRDCENLIDVLSAVTVGRK